MTEGAPNGSMACCTMIPSSWRTVTASQHRVEARPLTAAGGHEPTTGPKAVDVSESDGRPTRPSMNTRLAAERSP
jgi:hypothetical protein